MSLSKTLCSCNFDETVKNRALENFMFAKYILSSNIGLLKFTRGLYLCETKCFVHGRYIEFD